MEKKKLDEKADQPLEIEYTDWKPEYLYSLAEVSRFFREIIDNKKLLGSKCPECGKDLIQRINKRRRTFYGCTGYPECRFLTNFKPLPQPCPQCGSLLTQHGKQAWCIKCSYKEKMEETSK